MGYLFTFLCPSKYNFFFNFNEVLFILYIYIFVVVVDCNFPQMTKHFIEMRK